ncbi:MAG: bifunctional DNA-formamidopyrimidine glycosylase/DNA-(apurinic or apyrimidinic site) lyase [Microbacteriaceae bacterium]|nr:bifunctional DNA-formamidopyrimidine glycosylase/DNA-(apurinic or apyrimidinic site) lyase [Microbacteriaceae bacterium]
MPELPEVEVVRAGLAPAVAGATVVAAEVFDARSLKRHISRAEQAAPARPAAAAGHGRTLSPEIQALRQTDFESRITGVQLDAPARRGKFLWIPIAGSGTALLAHLAMSGQLLLRAPDAPEDKHVRIRLWVETASAGQVRLDFADQRRFGSLAIDSLVPTADGFAAGWGTELPLLPGQAAHIGRDLLDPVFDFKTAAKSLKLRQTALKKLLLEQSLFSGIGNIYADEALWQAGLHPETAAHRVSAARLEALLRAAAEVMQHALAQGGTSFDAQYVNVDGEAGYFARDLNAYGRAGKPCLRCGTEMTAQIIGGRSSTFCPNCQKRR